MITESSQKIQISGSGTVSGGSYDAVRIDGSGIVTGDVECRSYISNGSSKITGSIQVNEMTSNGSAEVTGHIAGNRIITNGSMTVEGNMTATYMKSAGSVRIGGCLNSSEIKSDGDLRVGSDCDVQLFKLRGSFRINGHLHAGHIDMKLFGNSDAKNIIAESIHVAKSKVSWISLILLTRKYPRLTADCIEGEHIELENTKAAVVRGGNVKIGKGCEIDLVEVSGHYEAEPGALVREVRRTGTV